jgi:ankyrin repeat protein
MLQRIVDGRTDLVFDYVNEGHSARSVDADGVSLMRWCARYGDVSAMRFLLAHGAELGSLGDDLGLGEAAFHGHWRLCQFLIEAGADVDFADPNTGETPLHAAASKANRPAYARVVKVLLAHGSTPMRRRRPTRKRLRSCAMLAPRGRRLCIAPPPSGPRSASSCCSTRAAGATRET